MKVLVLLMSFSISLGKDVLQVGVLPKEKIYLPHWKYISSSKWSGYYGELMSILEEALDVRYQCDDRVYSQYQDDFILGST